MYSNTRPVSFTEALKERVPYQNSSRPYQKPKIFRDSSQPNILANRRGMNVNYEEESYREQELAHYNYTQIESQYSHTESAPKGLTRQTLSELMTDYESNPDNDYTITFDKNEVGNRFRPDIEENNRQKKSTFEGFIQKQAQKQNHHYNQYQEESDYMQPLQQQSQTYQHPFSPKFRDGGAGNYRNTRMQVGTNKVAGVNLAQISANHISNQQQHPQFPSTKTNINNKPFMRDIFGSSSESEPINESEFAGYITESEQTIRQSILNQEMRELQELTSSQNKRLQNEINQLKIRKVQQFEQSYRNNRDKCRTQNWLMEVKTNFVEEVQIMAEEIISKRRVEQPEGGYIQKQVQSRKQNVRNEISEYLKMKNSSRVLKMGPSNCEQSRQKCTTLKQNQLSVNPSGGGVGYSFANQFELAQQVSNLDEKVKQGQERQSIVQQLTEQVEKPQLRKQSSRPAKEQTFFVPNVSSIQSEEQALEEPDKRFLKLHQLQVKKQEKKNSQNTIQDTANFAKKNNQPSLESIQIQNNSLNYRSNASSMMQPADVRIVESKLIFNGNQNGISLRSDVNEKHEPRPDQPRRTEELSKNSSKPGLRVVYDGMLEFKKKYPAPNQNPVSQPQQQNPRNQLSNNAPRYSVSTNVCSKYKQEKRAQVANITHNQLKRPLINSIKGDNFLLNQLENQPRQKQQTNRNTKEAEQKKGGEAVPMIKQSKGIRSSLAKISGKEQEHNQQKRSQLLPPNTSNGKENIKSSIKWGTKDENSQQSGFVLELDLNTSDY